MAKTLFGLSEIQKLSYFKFCVIMLPEVCNKQNRSTVVQQSTLNSHKIDYRKEECVPTI